MLKEHNSAFKRFSFAQLIYWIVKKKRIYESIKRNRWNETGDIILYIIPPVNKCKRNNINRIRMPSFFNPYSNKRSKLWSSMAARIKGKAVEEFNNG